MTTDDTFGGGILKVNSSGGVEVFKVRGRMADGAVEADMRFGPGTGAAKSIQFGIVPSAQILLHNAAGEQRLKLLSQDGDGNSRVVTQVLEITGGSDLSEQFEVAGSAPVEPGMVVRIDPDRPGALVVSDEAYDHRVAGIVSGAGGIRTGLVMGQEGSIADGRHPIALTGRVYCNADASAEPIRPGDLLTTSPVPGHVMRVTDSSRAQGAIVGKAMTALDAGRGQVLVLVNLQ